MRWHQIQVSFQIRDRTTSKQLFTPKELKLRGKKRFWHFATKEDIQTNNKCLKRCLTPLDIRDKVKPHLNATTWPTEGLKWETGDVCWCWQAQGQIRTTTWENREAERPTANQTYPLWSSHWLPGVYPKEIKYPTANVPNSQTLETVQMPVGGRMDKQSTLQQESHLTGSFPGAASFFLWICVLSGRRVHFGKIRQAAPTRHEHFSTCELYFH